MFEPTMGKAMLVASAIAGIALIATPSPGKAASPAYCHSYAQHAADRYAPHRGLIGSAIALPFDITGAVLTGQTPYGARWEHAYNRAYADCRASGGVAMAVPQSEAFAVTPGVAEPAPAPEEGGSCDFTKYHSSWDPTRC
jgi:hypothetical protein